MSLPAYGSVSAPTVTDAPDLTSPSPPYPPLTRPKRGLLNRVAILMCAAVIGTR